MKFLSHYKEQYQIFLNTTKSATPSLSSTIPTCTRRKTSQELTPTAKKCSWTAANSRTCAMIITSQTIPLSSVTLMASGIRNFIVIQVGVSQKCVNGPAFFYLTRFLYEILKSFLSIRKNQKIQVELLVSSILPKVVKISYW